MLCLLFLSRHVIHCLTRGFLLLLWYFSSIPSTSFVILSLILLSISLVDLRILSNRYGRWKTRSAEGCQLGTSACCRIQLHSLVQQVTTTERHLQFGGKSFTLLLLWTPYNVTWSGCLIEHLWNQQGDQEVQQASASASSLRIFQFPWKIK